MDILSLERPQLSSCMTYLTILQYKILVQMPSRTIPSPAAPTSPRVVKSVCTYIGKKR